MIRTALVASLMAVGVAGAASASELRVTAQGETFAVAYPRESNLNVIGGGAVTVTGNGENASYAHAPGAPSQRGRIATVVGGGNHGSVVAADELDATGARRG
jgi:hypothetical protein